MADKWLRAVIRRPGRILNRATGLPLVKWARYRPIVVTDEELETAIADGVIRDTDIEFLHAKSPEPSEASRLPTLAEAERSHIIRALEGAAWNKKEAARMLAISRGTLYRKIVEYGLEPGIKDPRVRTPRD